MTLLSDLRKHRYRRLISQCRDLPVSVGAIVSALAAIALYGSESDAQSSCYIRP
jgi:hypothetical protein